MFAALPIREYLAMVNWTLINATSETVESASSSLQAAKGAIGNSVNGEDSKLSINSNKAALYKLFGKLYIANFFAASLYL